MLYRALPRIILVTPTLGNSDMKRHRVDIHKCQYARKTKGITFSLLRPVMASKEEINILTGESKKFKYRREVHNYDPTKFVWFSVYNTSICACIPSIESLN